MASMAALLRDPAMLRGSELDDAATALEHLRAYLSNAQAAGKVRIVPEGTAEEAVVVPALAFRLFVEVLAQLANGNAVTIVPIHAELTTQQAADLLNVSRPYVIKLLDDGEIEYRRVGNRRKIRFEDLAEYTRRRSDTTREALEELTREAERLGLDYS